MPKNKKPKVTNSYVQPSPEGLSGGVGISSGIGNSQINGFASEGFKNIGLQHTYPINNFMGVTGGMNYSNFNYPDYQGSDLSGNLGMNYKRPVGKNTDIDLTASLDLNKEGMSPGFNVGLVRRFHSGGQIPPHNHPHEGSQMGDFGRFPQFLDLNMPDPYVAPRENRQVPLNIQNFQLEQNYAKLQQEREAEQKRLAEEQRLVNEKRQAEAGAQRKQFEANPYANTPSYTAEPSTTAAAMPAVQKTQAQADEEERQYFYNEFKKRTGLDKPIDDPYVVRKMQQYKDEIKREEERLAKGNFTREEYFDKMARESSPGLGSYPKTLARYMLKNPFQLVGDVFNPMMPGPGLFPDSKEDIYRDTYQNNYDPNQQGYYDEEGNYRPFYDVLQKNIGQRPGFVEDHRRIEEERNKDLQQARAQEQNDIALGAAIEVGTFGLGHGWNAMRKVGKSKMGKFRQDLTQDAINAESQFARHRRLGQEIRQEAEKKANLPVGGQKFNPDHSISTPAKTEIVNDNGILREVPVGGEVPTAGKGGKYKSWNDMTLGEKTARSFLGKEAKTPNQVLKELNHQNATGRQWIKADNVAHVENLTPKDIYRFSVDMDNREFNKLLKKYEEHKAKHPFYSSSAENARTPSPRYSVNRVAGETRYFDGTGPTSYREISGRQSEAIMMREGDFAKLTDNEAEAIYRNMAAYERSLNNGGLRRSTADIPSEHLDLYNNTVASYGNTIRPQGASVANQATEPATLGPIRDANGNLVSPPVTSTRPVTRPGETNTEGWMRRRSDGSLERLDADGNVITPLGAGQVRNARTGEVSSIDNLNPPTTASGLPDPGYQPGTLAYQDPIHGNEGYFGIRQADGSVARAGNGTLDEATAAVNANNATARQVQPTPAAAPEPVQGTQATPPNQGIRGPEPAPPYSGVDPNSTVTGTGAIPPRPQVRQAPRSANPAGEPPPSTSTTTPDPSSTVAERYRSGITADELANSPTVDRTANPNSMTSNETVPRLDGDLSGTNTFDLRRSRNEQDMKVTTEATLFDRHGKPTKGTIRYKRNADHKELEQNIKDGKITPLEKGESMDIYVVNPKNGYRDGTVSLKTWTDDSRITGSIDPATGEAPTYYYMSALGGSGANPIGTATAYAECRKHLPVGGTLMEKVSLSHDSFRNIVAEVKRQKKIVQKQVRKGETPSPEFEAVGMHDVQRDKWVEETYMAPDPGDGLGEITKTRRVKVQETVPNPKARMEINHMARKNKFPEGKTKLPGEEIWASKEEAEAAAKELNEYMKGYDLPEVSVVEARQSGNSTIVNRAEFDRLEAEALANNDPNFNRFRYEVVEDLPEEFVGTTKQYTIEIPRIGLKRLRTILGIAAGEEVLRQGVSGGVSSEPQQQSYGGPITTYAEGGFIPAMGYAGGGPLMNYGNGGALMPYMYPQQMKGGGKFLGLTGSQWGAGTAGALQGVAGSLLPGQIGDMAVQGIGSVHGMIDKDVTDADRAIMGGARAAGAGVTAIATGGATLAAGADDMVVGTKDAVKHGTEWGQENAGALDTVGNIAGMAASGAAGGAADGGGMKGAGQGVAQAFGMPGQSGGGSTFTGGTAGNTGAFTGQQNMNGSNNINMDNIMNMFAGQGQPGMGGGMPGGMPGMPQGGMQGGINPQQIMQFAQMFNQADGGPIQMAQGGFKPHPMYKDGQMVMANDYETHLSLKEQGYGHQQMMSNGGLTAIENGGTHEQNPMGGVPVGPNALVEQGETIMDLEDKVAGGKFVFSDRRGPKGKRGSTWADISKRVERKYKDREGDAAAKRAMDQELIEIAEMQEAQKAKEMARLQKQMTELNPSPAPTLPPGMQVGAPQGPQGMPQGMPQMPGQTPANLPPMPQQMAANGGVLYNMGGMLYAPGGPIKYNNGGWAGMFNHGQAWDMAGMKNYAKTNNLNWNDMASEAQKAGLNLGNIGGAGSTNQSSFGPKTLAALNALQGNQAGAAASGNQGGFNPPQQTQGLPPVQGGNTNWQNQVYGQSQGQSPQQFNNMISQMQGKTGTGTGTGDGSGTPFTGGQPYKAPYGSVAAGQAFNSLGDMHSIYQGMFNKGDVPELGRMNPEHIDLHAQRQALNKQAGNSLESVRQGMRKAGDISSLVAAHSTLDENLGQGLAKSYSDEENFNTMLDNKAKEYNIGKGDTEQMLAIQRDEAAKQQVNQGLHGLGENIGQGFKDVRDHQAVDQRNKMQMAAINATSENFDWDQYQKMLNFVS